MIATVRFSATALVLALVYLLLVTSVDRAEVVVAVLLAAAGAALGGMARTGGEQVRAKHVPLAALRTVPLAVLTGTWQVLRAAVGGQHGRLRESVVRVPGRDDEGVTTRAFGALSISAGPSSVWVEADPGNGTVLLHLLGPQQPGSTERSLS